MGFLTVVSEGIENDLERGGSNGGKTSKEATATVQRSEDSGLDRVGSAKIWEACQWLGRGKKAESRVMPSFWLEFLAGRG